jgi:mono/diheme cytochrome c family protein
MLTRHRHLCSLVLILSVSATLRAEQPNHAETASTASSADAGKRLFNSIGCWACHGFNGQGGIGGGMAGPQIAPDVLPRDTFLHILRRPLDHMPPYGEKVLTDSQIDDIYAYLRSLPAPLPAKDIPLLMKH